MFYMSQKKNIVVIMSEVIRRLLRSSEVEYAIQFKVTKHYPVWTSKWKVRLGYWDEDKWHV